MSGGLSADALVITANSYNAVMVTETMPDDPVLIINTGPFIVYMGTTSSVGDRTGVPVEPNASLLWNFPGQLWAKAEPDAAAEKCAITLTALASQWNANPAVVGALIAAEMINAITLGVPAIPVYNTVTDMNAATPLADGFKAYVIATSGFYSRINQVWVPDSLDLGAPGGNPDLMIAVGSAYGNWTGVGLGEITTSLSASGGFLRQTFTAPGATTVSSRTRTGGVWTPWAQLATAAALTALAAFDAAATAVVAGKLAAMPDVRSGYATPTTNSGGAFSVLMEGGAMTAAPIATANTADIPPLVLVITGGTSNPPGFTGTAFTLAGAPVVNTVVRMRYIAST